MNQRSKKRERGDKIEEKKKIHKQRIGVTFTQPYLDCMDYLVEQGVYLDYQTIIRVAVRLHLGSYGLAPFYLVGHKIEASKDECEVEASKDECEVEASKDECEVEASKDE